MLKLMGLSVCFNPTRVRMAAFSPCFLPPQVVEVVQQLLAGGGLPNSPADIGVITPYSGQVQLLQRLLRPLSSGSRAAKGAAADQGRRAGGHNHDQNALGHAKQEHGAAGAEQQLDSLADGLASTQSGG